MLASGARDARVRDTRCSASGACVGLAPGEIVVRVVRVRVIAHFLRRLCLYRLRLSRIETGIAVAHYQLMRRTVPGRQVAHSAKRIHVSQRERVDVQPGLGG